MKQGVSICIVTRDSFFYNRLAVKMIREMTQNRPYEIVVFDNGSSDGSKEWLDEQHDVQLYSSNGSNIGHGRALDYLVSLAANFDVCCTLCSDAFPISPEWLDLAEALNENNWLAGIDKGWGRLLKHYVCPSYLLGKTEYLKTRTFQHNWPNWDTGEKVSKDVVDQGKSIQFVEAKHVDFDGKFKPKPCDYSGLVWHTWFSTRKGQVDISGECESDYHSFVINWLRDRYSLDF